MEAIQSFDFSVLNGIQNFLKCGFLDWFTVFLSYVTTSGIIWIVLGVLLLFFRKTRAAGIILLAALAVGFLTGDVLLKHIVARPRPFTVSDFSLLIKAPSGSSFPSTHSCLAAAVTTVLLAKKRTLGFIALGLTICIAFSRLYLYVHFPTDVLCGLLLGILSGLFVLWLAKLFKLEKRLGTKR